MNFEEKRTEYIGIRVTPAFKKLLEKKKSDTGFIMTLSSYVLTLLEKEVDKDVK